MGKKRVAEKKGNIVDTKAKAKQLSQKSSRKRLSSGTLHVRATYNNTTVSLTTKDGDMVYSTSSGALGFRGAKKGTPFAAAKVGELVGERAAQLGVEHVDVIVKGVGAGRESSIRAFASKGIDLTEIKDKTPIPHNGTRPRRPRRV